MYRFWICSIALELLLFSGCDRPFMPATDRYARWNAGGMYSGGIAGSPTSNELVVSTPESGRGDLWKVDCDGKFSDPISETSESEIDPYFSSDGKLLYFSRFVQGRYQIYVRDMSSRQEQAVTQLAEHATYPVPVPDGSALLFVRVATSVSSSLAEIWELNLQNQELRRLTNNAVYDGHMTCFKDGKRILFYRDEASVMIMNRETLECTTVCDGFKPVLNDDETAIYVSRRREPSYNYDLWRHEIKTGTEQSFPLDGTLIQAVCKLTQDRIAIVSDLYTDRAGRISILDCKTGEWQKGPRLLELSTLQRRDEISSE